MASLDATRSSEFQRLGLTDAAVLETVSDLTPVLTVDHRLYIAASKKNSSAAVNFRHLP